MRLPRHASASVLARLLLPLLARMPLPFLLMLLASAVLGGATRAFVSPPELLALRTLRFLMVAPGFPAGIRFQTEALPLGRWGPSAVSGEDASSCQREPIVSCGHPCAAESLCGFAPSVWFARVLIRLQ